MGTVVITIATGKYVKYLEDLFKSCIENLPKDTLYEIWTDNSDLIKSMELPDLIVFQPLEHEAWPSITNKKFDLLKRSLVAKRKDDKIIYMDASMRIHGNPFDTLEEGKVSVHQHFLWDYIDEDQKVQLHSDVVDSVSFIPKLQRTNYIHAGFLVGGRDELIALSNEVSRLMRLDRRAFVQPKWHDESYLNKIYVENPDLFKVLTRAIYDEGAPNRYKDTKFNYLTSFADCADCQALKQLNHD